MADLPDLDTGAISFVAYYNIVDQGGLSQDFDISEILNSGKTGNPTLYDNGVEGTYNGQNGATLNIRGKDDGWIIAWLDRSGSDTTTQSAQPNGKWDLVNGWGDGDGGEYGETALPDIENLTNNTLERCIQNLQSQLSNSAGIDYTASDVGLFNFEYLDATTVTALSNVETENGDDAVTYTTTVTFTYTDATNLYEHWAMGHALAYTTGNGGQADARVTVEGEKVAEANSYDSPAVTEYGVRDGIYLGLAPDSGVGYDTDHYMNNSRESSAASHSRITNLFIWG